MKPHSHVAPRMILLFQPSTNSFQDHEAIGEGFENCSSVELWVNLAVPVQSINSQLQGMTSRPESRVPTSNEVIVASLGPKHHGTLWNMGPVWLIDQAL